MLSPSQITQLLTCILLLTLTGCRSCCNTPSPPKPTPKEIVPPQDKILPARTETEEYKLVSSTQGEIIKLICCIKSAVEEEANYKFFIGLQAEFGAKVIAVEKTVNLSQSARQLAYSYNNELNTSFVNSLKSFVGNNGYEQLTSQSKFKQIINAYEKDIKFKPNTAPFTPQDLLDFKQQVELLTQQQTYKVLQQTYNLSQAQIPAIAVNVILEEEAFTDPTKPTLNFWVQDQGVVFQQFSSTEKIKFLYSQGNTTMSQSIARIKDTIKYIEADSTTVQNLQGGNILQLQNTVVLGYDIGYNNQIATAQTRQNPRTYRQKLSTQLEKELKEKYIIWSGTDEQIYYPAANPQPVGHQPVFHLDMYFTPSGIINNNKYIVFAGYVDTQYYNQQYLNTQNRQRVIHTLNQKLKQAQTQLINQFDSLKRTNPQDTALKSILIVRVPLLVEFWDETDSIRYYHSYNNAHVEIRSNQKTIYLPKYQTTKDIRYGKAQIDAKKIYTDYKYKVKELDPFANQIGNGALHCYSKVIWRSKE